jgi:nucleoside-diphosphate-sugar epimerase
MQDVLRARYFAERKLLVTGATGFIGGSLCHLLGKVENPTATIPRNVPGVVVIHLACAINCNDPESYATNARLDALTVDLCKKYGWTLVYASTNNVYLRAINCKPGIHESPIWNDFYAGSKLAGEQLVAASGVRFAVVRLGDVFGIGQRHGNLMKALQAQIKARQPLTQFGAGAKVRSYISVSKLVAILLHLADHLRETTVPIGTLNICFEQPMSTAMIIQHLSATTQLPVDIKPLAQDTSYLDVRTMLPTTIPGYELSQTMRDALDEMAGAVVSGPI